jgi:hypothetical protein
MELFESLDAGSTAMGGKKTGQRYAAPAAGTEGRSVTFLDVHCGVSMGVMAGIDVGAAGRYEYLIMGPPMSDVAIAEGDAAKGELVISPEVHDFLHRYNGPGSQPASGQEGIASPDKKTAPQVGEEVGCFCFLRPTPKVYPKEAPASESPANSVFCRPAQPDAPGAQLPCGCCVTPSSYFRVSSGLADPLVGKARTAPSSALSEAQQAQRDVHQVFDPIKHKLAGIEVATKAWAAASGM